MPQWAHLPLILGPSGKLSKRDGAKYGFPVFGMSWSDPATGETTEGFREKGFLPEAFINFLALLGWNNGTDQEIFTKAALIEQFSIERVHSAGAKFDFEKAKWFNHEWIKNTPAAMLEADVQQVLNTAGITVSTGTSFQTIIDLVKERCVLLGDFVQQAGFFFKAPVEWDLDAIKGKWTPEKTTFFNAFAEGIAALASPEAVALETYFKELAQTHAIKPGELQLPLRIMLVGGKFGPPVFEIAEKIGIQETVQRIKNVLAQR